MTLCGHRRIGLLNPNVLAPLVGSRKVSRAEDLLMIFKHLIFDTAHLTLSTFPKSHPGELRSPGTSDVPKLYDRFL